MIVSRSFEAEMQNVVAWGFKGHHHKVLLPDTTILSNYERIIDL
jgi:hypothetical protein